MHNGTHLPCNVSLSTPQHIAPSTQLSMPLVALSSTVQGSPGNIGFGSIDVHFVVFQLPPSLPHGMHFKPGRQFCVQVLQPPPPPPPPPVVLLGGSGHVNEQPVPPSSS